MLILLTLLALALVMWVIFEVVPWGRWTTDTMATEEVKPHRTQNLSAKKWRVAFIGLNKRRWDDARGTTEELMQSLSGVAPSPSPSQVS